MSNLLRFERLGLPDDFADPRPSIKEINRSLRPVVKPELAQRLIPTHHRERVFHSDMAAIQYFLKENLIEARSWGKKTVGYASAYFLGPWRDEVPSGNHADQPPDRVWWDVNAVWQTAYVATMRWAATQGDWDGLRQISGRISSAVIRDIDQSEANRAWLLMVAGCLQGRSWNELTSLNNIVQASRAKREQLLVNWLRAIVEGSKDEVDRAGKEYAMYFVSKEAKAFTITGHIMADGTFLYHYSAFKGKPVTLKPEILDNHVVIL